MEIMPGCYGSAAVVLGDANYHASSFHSRRWVAILESFHCYVMMPLPPDMTAAADASTIDTLI